MSASALGPWTTASSVPQVIYTIPPSSPVYSVTYVTQVTTSSGDVQSSYTAGYLGAFVMGAAVGAIVTSGTGYYYPPYVGYPAYGYPVYHPYPTPYGVYGAYGSTAYLPHGNRSIRRIADSVRTLWLGDSHGVLQPLYGNIDANRFDIDGLWQTECGPARTDRYTGSYGATHQGSSPAAQCGQSYVSQGEKQIRHDAALFNGEWNGGLVPRGRKVGKATRHPARMETRTRGRTRVATCTQDTTGMCTKTQVLDGRNPMGMEAGLM